MKASLRLILHPNGPEGAAVADSNENHQVIDEEKEDDEITSTPDNSVSMPAVEEILTMMPPAETKSIATRKSWSRPLLILLLGRAPLPL